MSHNESTGSDQYYHDKISIFRNIEDIVRITGAVLSVVLFIPHILTYLIFKEWRQQEHNRVFLHFVSALLVHDCVTPIAEDVESALHLDCFTINFESPDIQICQRMWFKILIPAFICYCTFLVCEWMFLFILCMRKMLVQVIISEDMYCTYIYILVYLVPIFVALIDYNIEIDITCIFQVITLFVCSIIYCLIIISVVRARKSRNAHTRRTVKLVTRFVILYTVVSAQVICAVGVFLVDFMFDTYEEYNVISNNFYEVIYYYYIVASILQNVSYISTPLCIIYCVFGNPNTRRIWSEYLRRKLRQL